MALKLSNILSEIEAKRSIFDPILIEDSEELVRIKVIPLVIRLHSSKPITWY